MVEEAGKYGTIFGIHVARGCNLYHLDVSGSRLGQAFVWICSTSRIPNLIDTAL